MVTLDDIKKLENDISVMSDNKKMLQKLTDEYIENNATFHANDLVLVCGDKTRINNRLPEEFYITKIDCMRLYDDKIQYGYIDTINQWCSAVHYISSDATIILLKSANVGQSDCNSNDTMYQKIKNIVHNFFISK